MSNLPMPDDKARFWRSSFYEKLVEHVFVAEVMQEAWFRHHKAIEVLRAEVDDGGYDLVLECNQIIRHVQLKTSAVGARTASQKVHVDLARKPSGCIVWMIRDEDSTTRRMKLSYRFFGEAPGDPLPPLSALKVARHTKGDVKGVKRERPQIRVVPKGRFTEIATTRQLVEHLFGSALRRR